MANEQEVWGDSEELALSASVILDPRLAEVWQLLWAFAPAEGDTDEAAWSLETLGALLRLAYVRGYVDATAEEVPGSLYAELGLRRPGRVSRPTSSGNRRARGRSRRDSLDT